MSRVAEVVVPVARLEAEVRRQVAAAAMWHETAPASARGDSTATPAPKRSPHQDECPSRNEPDQDYLEQIHEEIHVGLPSAVTAATPGARAQVSASPSAQRPQFAGAPATTPIENTRATTSRGVTTNT